MGSITNIENILRAKQAKEDKVREESNKLSIALANGYENYEDYEYSVSKIYSRDPRFSLNRVYQKLCDKYLLDSIKLYMNYIRTGNRYIAFEGVKGRVLTIYAINELTSAILEKNDIVCDYLKSIHYDSIDFLKSLTETSIGAEKMFELRKRRI